MNLFGGAQDDSLGRDYVRYCTSLLFETEIVFLGGLSCWLYIVLLLFCFRLVTWDLGERGDSVTQKLLSQTFGMLTDCHDDVVG